MNESHRNHRKNPHKYPRRNYWTALERLMHENRLYSGQPGGNAHDRRKAKRAIGESSQAPQEGTNS